MVTWDRVTQADVLRAIQEYDRLGPEEFFAAHGFGPTTTTTWSATNAATRLKRSWARPTSSPPAGASPPPTSKAAKPAPSPSSEN